MYPWIIFGIRVKESETRTASQLLHLPKFAPYKPINSGCLSLSNIKKKNHFANEDVLR
jgi:hypothetical protein